MLDVDSEGKIFPKCQATDYQLRGDLLEDYNVLDFFMDTYEKETQSRDNKFLSGEDNDLPRMGRLPSTRSPYRRPHPKAKVCHRVVRNENHNNLPNFMGPWLPRHDEPAIYPLYYASMLMLLKPWRTLSCPQTDLGTGYE
jgi:hypothetical protein